MRTSAFFRWVWRFNALAIAGVAVIGGLLGLAALYFVIADLTAERRVGGLVNIDPAYEESTVEQIRGFAPLGREGLLWAAIERSTVSPLRTSSKRAAGVADYIIYDPTQGASRRLLGVDDALILEARLLYALDDEAKRRPALALLARYVDHDSNDDQRLNHLDVEKLALARADGTRLVTFAEADESLGVNAISMTEAVAMIRTGETVEALHVDLRSLSVTRRAPIEP